MALLGGRKKVDPGKGVAAETTTVESSDTEMAALTHAPVAINNKRFVGLITTTSTIQYRRSAGANHLPVGIQSGPNV